MAVAQIQLDTAGHNIANVNKKGFSRQRVELVSRLPVSTPFGQIGRGVSIDQIARVRDTFLDGLFRRQVAGLADAEIRNEFFTRVEDVFLEPGENGLSSRINQFFDSLSEFANNVEELPVRQSVLNEAAALSGLFRETADRLFTLRTNANEEVINFVPEINSLAERIAATNAQIRRLEVGGQPASDLRDDRDVLLDDLSRIVSITTKERDNGVVDIFISGEVLVDDDNTRALEAVRVPTADPERQDLVEVRFVDNGVPLTVEDGELFGALALRDGDLVEIDDRLDQIAGAIINEINRVHSQGNGLTNISGPVQSTNLVSNAGAPLSSAGLPFNMTAGSFDVNLYGPSGNLLGSTTIAVDPNSSSLNSVASSLGVFGSVVNGNVLQIQPFPGTTMTFSNDTSGVLAALGMNGLFTGTDARTIGVNQEIVDDPNRLSSANSLDPLDTGDNTAALAMANVRNGVVLDGNTATINDFYESTIVKIGIDARANAQNLDVEQAFVTTFERRRQEVSGVSIDEEVTLLLQFQRAFEASARVVSVTDRMLDALLTMAL